MLYKLAIRNVKRQMSSYIIYFVTVALTIAMLFALCNLIYSKQLLEFAAETKEMMTGLIALSVAVSLIAAFVLGCASSYMLKLRKHEFATYLTLGMRRSNIIALYSIENMIIGAVSLAAGLILGLFLYQGILSIVMKLLGLSANFAGYSVSGFLLTIILSAGMFLFSVIFSSLYLKKASIYSLLYSGKNVVKQVKHPILWHVLVCISAAGLAAGVYIGALSLRELFTPNGSGNLYVTVSVALIMVSVVVLHISLAKSLVNLLLKNRRFKARNINIFVLRQLSAQLNTNAVLCGIIAFLITASVMLTNICMADKTTLKAWMEKNLPFDISLNKNEEKNAPYTHEEATSIIKKYTHIKSTFDYKIYSTGNSYLHSFTPWKGEMYDNLCDSMIKESDFNNLMNIIGKEPVDLKGGIIILADDPAAMDCNFSEAEIKCGGRKYKVTDVTNIYPSLSVCYFLAVVPDELTKGLTVENEYEAITLSNGHFNSSAMNDELSYSVSSEGGYNVMKNPYSIRSYYEDNETSRSTLVIVGELYISFVFILLSIAILTMRQLSLASEDKIRYGLLFKLGAGRKEQERALFIQTASLFLLPFVIPLLLSIPSALYCAKLAEIQGSSLPYINQMYLNSLIIALSILLIQLLYMTATYDVSKRKILL